MRTKNPVQNKMAPVEHFAFPDKTAYPQCVHSVDEGEKAVKPKINRQMSSNYPEQQDAKEIPSFEEWRRSLALLSVAAQYGAVLQLAQTQMVNTVHPVEHPLSPVLKKEKEVDHWPGQTLGVEENVTRCKFRRKRAVEHELDVIHTSKLDTFSGQKEIEKQSYPYIQTKSLAEMEEKCSITCTEDSNPEELLLVTLPPHPPPAVEDRVTELEFEEQNNAVYVPDIVVDQEKVADNTASQAKEKIFLRRSPRRQTAGKAKRNQYYVTEASPPPAKRRKKVKEKPAAKKAQLDNEANEEYPVVLAKQKTDRVKEIKKKKSSGRQTYRVKENQNRRKSQMVGKENENLENNSTVTEVDHCLSELKELVKRAEMFKFWSPVRNKVTTENYHHTRKKSNDSVHAANDSEAVDSGVGSGSSGSLDGNNGSSGSGGSNVPGGGGGNIGGGGDKSNGQDDDDGGDDDDDDDNRKKRQPWESGEEMVNSSEEEKMETDEEECSSEEFPDCKEPVRVEYEETDGGGATGVQGSDQEIGGAEPFQVPVYAPQDVRHSAYCTQKKCPNPNCSRVKTEFDHLTNHKEYDSCERCFSCYKVITDHSKTCPLPGCRVPFCADLKKNTKTKKIQQAPKAVMQPTLQPYQNVGFYGAPPFAVPIQPFVPYGAHPKYQNVIDGKVLLQNSDLLPPEGRFFQEHIDYHVQREKLLGKGTNGNVYLVLARTSSLESKQMAMKVTNYAIGQEEIDVYKALGTDHENIVATHGVTFKGSERRACIFMEKCDKSLWNLLSEIPANLLNVEEAMYYVCQVLEAIDYMHSKCVIHRDIKAKNVMLSKEHDFVRAKLGDMDSAKLLENEFTKKGLNPVGTPGFAAHEVRRKQPHGRPADIYSTGCFILELTVGVPTGDTLHQKIEMLRQKDPELASIVAECVNEDFTHRPTAKELLAHPRIAKYKMARTVPPEV